ncbi:ECF transporter S component [Candidatus Thorarchaeota archaeon]|nr:MAG: ECF transporter S component [Candidatus Thorarchaeota archaeon]
MEYFNPKTRSYSVYLSLVAILTGLTTVATIIIAIPFPTSTGFLNFGDAMVMLSGILLGPSGAFLAGGVGSAMGDIALGYVHFAPITLVVKGLEGLIVGLFSSRVRTSKTLKTWDIVGLILSSLAMLIGYFLAEVPLVGYEAALAELLTLNWIQVTVGSIIAALVGPITRGFLQESLYIPEDEILEEFEPSEFDAAPKQTT